MWVLVRLVDEDDMGEFPSRRNEAEGKTAVVEGDEVSDEEIGIPFETFIVNAVVPNCGVSKVADHCLQFLVGDSRKLVLAVGPIFLDQSFHCVVRVEVLKRCVRLTIIDLLKMSPEELYFLVVESSRFAVTFQLMFNLSRSALSMISIYSRPNALTTDLRRREGAEQLLEGGRLVICQGVSYQ